MKKRKTKYSILKPCPKCGSDRICITHWKTLFFTTKFSIECYDCSHSIQGLSEKKVIKKWGTIDDDKSKDMIEVNMPLMEFNKPNKNGTIINSDAFKFKESNKGPKNLKCPNCK